MQPTQWAGAEAAAFQVEQEARRAVEAAGIQEQAQGGLTAYPAASIAQVMAEELAAAVA